MAKSVEDMCKERERLGVQLENDIAALAQKIQKFTELSLEVYNKLNNPDCLYYDSPVSPFKSYHFLKEWMVKNDMDFIGLFIPDGKVSVVPFSKRTKEATGWALRFVGKSAPEKTGIEAIL